MNEHMDPKPSGFLTEGRLPDDLARGLRIARVIDELGRLRLRCLGMSAVPATPQGQVFQQRSTWDFALLDAMVTLREVAEHQQIGEWSWSAERRQWERDRAPRVLGNEGPTPSGEPIYFETPGDRAAREAREQDRQAAWDHLIVRLQEAEVTTRWLAWHSQEKQIARKGGAQARDHGLTSVESQIAWALTQPDLRRYIWEAVHPTAFDVVAAVRRDDQGRVWMARRNGDGAHGGLAGMWEYPGGKVEPGEQLRDALARELQEEFGVAGVSIGRVLDSIDDCKTPATGENVYRVTFFEVDMPEPAELRKHTEARWMTPDEACAVEQLPSGTMFNARHLSSSPTPEAVARVRRLLVSELGVAREVYIGHRMDRVEITVHNYGEWLDEMAAQLAAEFCGR